MAYSIVLSVVITLLMIAGIISIILGARAKTIVSYGRATLHTSLVGIVLIFLAFLFYFLSLTSGLIPYTIFPLP